MHGCTPAWTILARQQLRMRRGRGPMSSRSIPGQARLMIVGALARARRDFGLARTVDWREQHVSVRRRGAERSGRAARLSSVGARRVRGARTSPATPGSAVAERGPFVRTPRSQLSARPGPSELPAPAAGCRGRRPALQHRGSSTRTVPTRTMCRTPRSARTGRPATRFAEEQKFKRELFGPVHHFVDAAAAGSQRSLRPPGGARTQSQDAPVSSSARAQRESHIIDVSPSKHLDSSLGDSCEREHQLVANSSLLQ